MEDEEEGPVWVELEPIGNEQQLDQALAEAQQLDLPIVREDEEGSQGEAAAKAGLLSTLQSAPHSPSFSPPLPLS